MARSTRRSALRLALILGFAGLVMARPWQGLRTPEVAFEDLPDLPPLRRLAGSGDRPAGALGTAVFVGLAPPDAQSIVPPQLVARLRREICEVLPLSWTRAEPIPITYFTDINCGVCRRLEADLRALDGEEPAFRLITREYPVLGPRSTAAARLVRAAAAQGRSEDVRAALMTRPAPDRAEAVAAFADRQGLRTDALVEAWQSADVRDSLLEDRALAHLFALPGTPGLVVGRTVVSGAPDRQTLAALISRERADGPPAACTPS